MQAGLCVLSALCAVSFSACGPSQAIIDVSVTGLSDDVAQLELAATLNDRGLSSTPEPIRQNRDHFELRLAAGDIGTLRVTVNAKDLEGCDVSIGKTEITIDVAGSYEAMLPLVAQPGCLLVVRKSGNGAGDVTLSDGTVWSFARPPKPEMSCPVAIAIDDVQQMRFALGAPVTLSGSVPTDELHTSYFAGWSGACQGGGACGITIDDHQTIIEAGFQPQLVCSVGNVCWENPRPQGTSLLRVVGRSTDDVWAVGASGVVLRWNGSYWSSPRRVQLADFIDGIWIQDQSNIVTVGERGNVLRLDDNVWGCPTNPSTNHLHDVWGDSAKDLWAVGEGGTILHYDGTWSAVSAPAGSTNLNALRGSSASDIFVVGEQGTLLHYDGTRFTALRYPTTDDLYGVWSSGAQEAWVVGANGSCAHIKDGVVTKVATDAPATLYSIWGSGSSDIWAVGERGTLLHYDGSRWSVFESGTALNLRSLWGSGVSDVWAVGDNGTLMHWNGALWLAESASRDDRSINKVWGLAASDSLQQETVYAVGDGGLALLWSGADWVAAPGIDNATGRSVNGIWGTSASNLWLCGSGGTIVHWDGMMASLVTLGAMDDLFGMWGRAANDILVVGASGRIARYDGTKWTTMVLGAAGGMALRAVWSGASGPDWLVGDGGTILNGDSAAVTGTPQLRTAGFRRATLHCGNVWLCRGGFA